MSKYYSDEVNAQIVVALLKAHGIRKVIASPGTTNMAVVYSMQNDPYFEMYSCVDERSAAYMACGLAAESGEPVVLSCTGATASRNYLPGLTEAYYRKLPVLAITSMQDFSKVGHLIAQTLDRSTPPADVVNLSVTLPVVKDDNDRWDCEIKVNKAILALTRQGGGPAHINIPTTYSRTYSTKELPKFRVINRIVLGDAFPQLPKGPIGIFVGSHKTMSAQLVEAIDRFCAAHNGVVFCNYSSSYKGKYRVLYSLVAGQNGYVAADSAPELTIHIGEVSGDYYSMKVIGKQVWRVSEDGEIRDTFQRLRYVFEMNELSFFEHYGKEGKTGDDSYLQACKKQLQAHYDQMPELPFSNPWIAAKIAHRIPEGSTIHFGILNSLRSWNFFELPESVTSESNVGGFGIDGGVSSLLGASLANRNKLYYCVIGDLAFFYDMNTLGNRHVGNNLRILLVNNGRGTEFRQYKHPGSILGEQADNFVAAAGHFGSKSANLVKHYTQDLGFEYLQADSKETFERECERFLTPKMTGKSMVFEVFTDSALESEALETILTIKDNDGLKDRTRQFAKQVLGQKQINILKKVIGRS